MRAFFEILYLKSARGELTFTRRRDIEVVSMGQDQLPVHVGGAGVKVASAERLALLAAILRNSSSSGDRSYADVV